MGRTVEIVYRTDLLQDRDWTGAANYSEDKIELLPISDIYKMSPAKAEQTFCHELAHFLLYHAGGAINHDLKSNTYIHKNEEFVDLLGSLLHQALKTMEYE
jgi:predicted SprT family Zn-dependent metalloprotease